MEIPEEVLAKAVDQTAEAFGLYGIVQGDSDQATVGAALGRMFALGAVWERERQESVRRAVLAEVREDLKALLDGR